MTKNILFACSILLLFYAQPASAQTDFVANAIKRIPREASTVEGFVPKGWIIRDQASDDLDGDNILDEVITLDLTSAEDKKPGDTDDNDLSPNIVAVLFGRAGGGFRLFAVNGYLHPSEADARSFISPRIEKGVLILNDNWGDGWANDITYRFRYDRALGKLMLIGFDHEHYDRTNIYAGHRSSENYLTGLRIDYAKALNRKTSSYSETRRVRIKRSVITFEQARLVDDPDNNQYKPY